MKGNYDEGFGREQHKTQWADSPLDSPSETATPVLPAAVATPVSASTPITAAALARSSTPTQGASSSPVPPAQDSPAKETSVKNPRPMSIGNRLDSRFLYSRIAL